MMETLYRKIDFKLDYLEGGKNVLADYFSRLPHMDNKILVGRKELNMIQKKGTLVDFFKL